MDRPFQPDPAGGDAQARRLMKKQLTPGQPPDPQAAFERERSDNISALAKAGAFREASVRWMADSAPYKYSYNFSWLGRPIIQYPQDIVAMQELIWQVKPDLVVETGVAHGGSILLYASILQRKDHKPDQRSDEDPGNPTVNFHGERRSNETHQSTTDPEALLARKGKGKEAKLCYSANGLAENRNTILVDFQVEPADGSAERRAAIAMADER